MDANWKVHSLILLISGHILVAHGDNPRVTFPDGILEGTILQDYNGEDYFGFRSIPFAVPPIGALRFTAAEKNEPWQGVRNSTIEAPFCLQQDSPDQPMIGDEDCLYLNVYTKSISQNSLLPVMVYIHGGKFTSGSGSNYGAEFLITRNIVLVTINYRLGLFGYLNLVNSNGMDAEEEMVTNNGFKDQILALKWVKKYIKFFGGNPEMVTLAGESAGGMSVHAHVLSPLSKGLFHRAILMSGTTIMPMVPALNDSAVPIAKYLGIDTSDHDAMVHQLTRTSSELLFKAYFGTKFYELQLNKPAYFGLTIEPSEPTNFMPDYPIKILQSGNYSKVPLLIGNNNMEGLLIYAIGLTGQDNMKDISTHIPFFFDHKEAAEEKIITFYGINETSTMENITFYTDAWFRFNAFRTAIMHARNNHKVYYYEFACDTELNYLKSKFPPINHFGGACHADELGYLFKFNETPAIKKGSIEEKLMLLMVEMWTDFVKGTKPHLQWHKIDAYDKNFANITNDGVQFDIVSDPSFKFWFDIYEYHGNSNY